MNYFNQLTKAFALVNTLQVFFFAVVLIIVPASEARARVVNDFNNTSPTFEGGGNGVMAPPDSNISRAQFYGNINGALDRLIEMLYGDIEPKSELFWEPQHSSHVGHDNAIHFTNEWLVHIDGGDEEAAKIAAEAGYENFGQVSHLEFYLIEPRLLQSCE